MLPGRISAAAVQGMLNVANTTAVDDFIDAANELVTEVCAPVAIGYSAHRLERIELFLSCHFYEIVNPRSTSEMAGSVSQSFQHKEDLGLALTHYGQQAMILDTHGGLAALNKKMIQGKNFKPRIKWLGTDDRYPTPAGTTFP